MTGLDALDLLFSCCAFLLQVILIFHFTLRRWRYETALRYGWIVDALSLPAAVVSVRLLVGGKTWSLRPGFFYLAWAIQGDTVEQVPCVRWRNLIRWLIFGPYVFLYLATMMFY